MSDLESGNPLLPPNLHTSSGLEIVPVHYYMDSEVESDGHPGYRGLSDKLCVAKERGCAVVVGMQECQRLLLKNQEDGVKQLEVLGEVVEVVENEQILGPASAATDTII